MKYPRKVDMNQPAIVLELRKRGCSVQSLAEIGKGCPDILVCAPYTHELYLIEIKNPTKPKADRQLTPAELDWHKKWIGPVHVIETADEAWAIVRGL